MVVAIVVAWEQEQEQEQHELVLVPCFVILQKGRRKPPELAAVVAEPRPDLESYC